MVLALYRPASYFIVNPRSLKCDATAPQRSAGTGQHPHMKLLVVIANYRVAHLTIDCLGSIANEIGSVPGTHVSICENGTGDDSADRIQAAIADNGWSSWCTLTVVSPNRASMASRSCLGLDCRNSSCCC